LLVFAFSERIAPRSPLTHFLSGECPKGAISSLLQTQDVVSEQGQDYARKQQLSRAVDKFTLGPFIIKNNYLQDLVEKVL
jgi:hypothetical protein